MAMLPIRLNKIQTSFGCSGIDQEDSILAIYPDCPIEEFRECLFLKQTNEKIAIWEGYKYTQEHATEVSGIKEYLLE
jgi:Xaa-Pro aminopeptidase